MIAISHHQTVRPLSGDGVSVFIDGFSEPRQALILQETSIKGAEATLHASSAEKHPIKHSLQCVEQALNGYFGATQSHLVQTKKHEPVEQ
jgi:hypothetical protein